MKYADKYPDMKPIHDERDLKIKGTDAPCMHCKESTPYIDICYEGHVCSDECMEAVDKAYYEA
jgi:hypothetical protein